MASLHGDRHSFIHLRLTTDHSGVHPVILRLQAYRRFWFLNFVGRNKAKPRIGRPILPTALTSIIIPLITISSPPLHNKPPSPFTLFLLFFASSSLPLIAIFFISRYIFIQVYTHFSPRIQHLLLHI